MEASFAIMLALISGAMYSFNGIFVKCFTRRFDGEESDSSAMYTLMLGIVISIVSFAINGFSFRFSPLTLLIAAVTSIGLIAHNVFIVRAMSQGPYSFISIFCMSGGIIMPLIVTMLVFSEIPGYIQLIGITVMFIAFGLICLGRGDGTVADKKKYFIYLVILFLANGLCAVGYTLEKRLEGAEYKQELIIMEYLITVGYTLVSLLIRRRGKALSIFRQNGEAYLFALLACLVLAIGNNLQLFSITGASEAVAFTAKNGSSIVLSALLALFIFAERIKASKWVAIGASVVSIFLLSL